MGMSGAGAAGGGGGRHRRRRAPVMAEINVTPMVDVMLVLLIIFMVAAPLLTTKWRRFRDYLSAGVVLSALLHFLVTGWGLFAFATGPLEAKTEDIVAVDVISDDKLSQMMKGIKTGDKNETKPQADKIGDLK